MANISSERVILHFSKDQHFFPCSEAEFTRTSIFRISYRFSIVALILYNVFSSKHTEDFASAFAEGRDVPFF